MNEAETRAEHIDPALAAAGWGVVEGSRIRREYRITLGRLEGRGRRSLPLSADYLLIYRNTKLAVVEAKDSEELKVTKEFKITIKDINDAPVLTDPGDQHSSQGQTISLQLVATDEDMPPQTLTFSATGLPAGLSQVGQAPACRFR